jgi:single-stranded DNA-specific DHH superfamily exonuclease
MRVAWQERLSAKEYGELMMDMIDEVSESRRKALEEIEREKVRIAKAYNKRIKERSFQVVDLVWKTILPLGVIGLESSRIVGKGHSGS